MSEDSTKKLPGDDQEAPNADTTRPMLDRLIKEMVDTRETLLERLDGMETRLTARMDGMDSRLERIEAQLRVLTQDVMQVRTDQQRLENRMDATERRPN